MIEDIQVRAQATLNQCAGAILKAHRTRLNLSQQDIAKMLNIARQCVSKRELGDTTLTLRDIHKFAFILNNRCW